MKNTVIEIKRLPNGLNNNLNTTEEGINCNWFEFELIWKNQPECTKEKKMENMNEKLRDMSERMRKFSECLIGILEGENRKYWKETISDCYTIKLKTKAKDDNKSQMDLNLKISTLLNNSLDKAKHIMKI